jgi:hypothetical protein
MKPDSVRRSLRTVLAVLATALAAVAAIAAGTPGAPPAEAATAGTDITLSLSPGSGSDYSTDRATLSWNVPSACIGQELDVFLYPGTGVWDTAAIEAAEGGNGPQEYFDFFDTTSASSADTSTSWPDVSSSGYQNFTNSAMYATTAALVSALGSGLYTIGAACVNTANAKPILDSGGNPVAGSILLDIGASGDGWGISPIVETSLSLSGSGAESGVGSGGGPSSVDLTADVTASDGSVPAGSVNFYAGMSATGTPLNGATPVPVGSDGQATYSGASGYPPSWVGWQPYAAQFVPANPAAYTGSAVIQTEVPLIGSNFTINVTARPDPSSPTSIDLTATATNGSPNVPLTSGGVDFVVDGTPFSTINSAGEVIPFLFNSSGVATATLTGIKGGTHAITALLETEENYPLNPSDGASVTVNTVSLTTGYRTTTALKATQTDDGLRLTATVTGPAGVTQAPPGTVSFADGSTSLGSAKLTASGTGTATAAVTDYSLPAGENDFTATYTAAANAEQFATSHATVTETLPKGVTWVQPGSPRIAGTAAVGDTLTVKPGTWRPPGVTLTYQWQADGTPITGATATTLKLTTAQAGKKIQVKVTGSKAGCITATTTSAPTKPITK